MSARRASGLPRVGFGIPVRIRHYWKLLVGAVGFLAVLTLVIDALPVRPYVTSAGSSFDTGVRRNIAGTRDLFDLTKAHSITLKYRESDYRRMLDGYFADSSKEYLAADVTIDGRTIPGVGMRLKGNSTLTALAARATGRPGSRFLPFEEPENLPWLLRFDAFFPGQRYQGYREIVFRAGGVGAASSLVVNEALSLGILTAIGEVVPRYGYANVAFNNRPVTTRLVVEQPGKSFARRLGGQGTLYKGLPTGQFTDQGDDQTAYQDDFQQITRKGSQDLQPVINLIRWVSTSSEAEFAQHLGVHVEIASFARYVALQNLLLNFDDMAGPGHNYYLWYELQTRKFMVVGWDYNLAFRGKASMGPRDSAAGSAQPVGHKLKERFLATPRFQIQYEDAYRELYRKIYANGQALRVLAATAAMFGGLHGYDQRKVTAEVDQLRLLVRDRTASLAVALAMP